MRNANRKESTTAVALVGEGRVEVTGHDGDYLLVDCTGRDDTVWGFLAAYHALPIVLECGGVRYARVSYRWTEGAEHTAYYKAG